MQWCILFVNGIILADEIRDGVIAKLENLEVGVRIKGF